MSYQAGGHVATGVGIGSRGSGETKIELDRRCTHTCMAKLCGEIRRMELAQRTRRLSRRHDTVPSVVTLGCTNAGKSTFLNQLTGAGALVGDALFATLDPTMRRTETVDGRVYTLTDIVGFVHDLPTQLAEAFRFTLEEVGEADLLVHAVDTAHPDPVGQVEAVHLVLIGVEGVSSISEIIVLGKADPASPEHLALVRIYFPEAIAVSADTGLGIDVLRHQIEEALPRPNLLTDHIVPYSRGGLAHTIHKEGEVEREEYVPEGTHVIACVSERLGAHIKEAGIILIGVGEDSFVGAKSLEQAPSIGAGSFEGATPDKREGFEGAVPKRMESSKGGLDD